MVKDVYNWLPSMSDSGKEIVERIKENDRFLIQALKLLSGKKTTISIKQKEEMLMNGIIYACLGVFKFPETIDWERDLNEPTLASTHASISWYCSSTCWWALTNIVPEPIPC
jgi:hypothetical protein